MRREAMRPLVPDDPPDPRHTVLRFDEEAVRVGKVRQRGQMWQLIAHGRKERRLTAAVSSPTRARDADFSLCRPASD